MISDSMLEGIRLMAESVMTATATLYRKGQVADDFGGFVDTYSAVGTYSCSYAPHQITPMERETTRGIETISMWRFQFPNGTDVRSTDRIVVDGRTFEVVSAGSGSIKVAVRVICQEIL